MILEIERLWGERPGWFSTLDVAEQERLLAWHRVVTDPAGKERRLLQAAAAPGRGRGGR